MAVADSQEMAARGEGGERSREGGAHAEVGLGGDGEAALADADAAIAANPQWAKVRGRGQGGCCFYDQRPPGSMQVVR